jgi:hypothetical protein
MNKNELLNSDFLKQFKTGDELNQFLYELQTPHRASVFDLCEQENK